MAKARRQTGPTSKKPAILGRLLSGLASPLAQRTGRGAGGEGAPANERPRPQPVHLLALLAAAVPLAVVEPFYDQVAMPRLAATVALTGLALLLLALRGGFAPSRRLVREPAVLALLAFLAIQTLATALGVDPIGSLFGEFQRYQGILVLIAYAALAVATALAVSRPSPLAQRTGRGAGGEGARARSATPLLWGLTAGGAAAATYAALDALGLDWLKWDTRAPDRLGGLFGQPNVLAIQLVVSACAAAALLRSVSGWRRDGLAAALGLMAAALVLTYSRGGWVGAGVAAVTFLGLQAPLRRSHILRLAPLALAAVALLAVVPQGRSVLDSAVARGQSTVDVRGQSTRLGLWKNALEMATDRPLVGAGPDAFSVLFPEYRDEGQAGVESRNVRPESAHNIWLDQLVGGGIPGLLAFAALAAIVLWKGGRTALRLAPGPDRYAFAGLVAAFAGYLTAASFAFAEAMTGWLPWLVGGAIIGLTWARDASPTEARKRLPESVPIVRTPVLPRKRPRFRVAGFQVWMLPSPSALGEGLGVRAAAIANALKRLRPAPATAIVRTALAALGLLLVAGALTLSLADLRAGQALRAATREDAVRDARTATRLNPLHPGYLLSLARLQSSGDTTAGYADAAATFHRHNQRFAPTAYSLVAEASALIAAGEPVEGERVARLLAQAQQLDPHNAEMHAAIASLRLQ